MRLLSCPFYAHQDPDLVQKMQNLFRYSLRLLQREGLLDQHATPQGLSGETWVGALHRHAMPHRLDVRPILIPFPLVEQWLPVTQLHVSLSRRHAVGYMRFWACNAPGVSK